MIIRRILQPIRASISVLSSTNSSLRCCTTTRNPLLNGNYKHLNTWVKGIESVSQGRASRFYDKLNIQKNGIHSLNFSGKSYGVRRIGVGSIIGMSVIAGAMSLWSQDAYAMNGTDVLEESHISNFRDLDDDQHVLIAFARRFWMPALLVITMVRSWDRPFILVIEVILYLLSTKPGALSVYVHIEKWRRQCIRRDPYSYIRKSSYYAKRVDVEDYVLLQLATVEFEDQEITLIGILGSWWVWDSTPCGKRLTGIWQISKPIPP